MPVICAVALFVVGGAGLEAALRRRQHLSVRLRAAEFEWQTVGGKEWRMVRL